MVGLDAQVGVRIARVRLSDDDTFDDNRLYLIVVRGKRGRVKARLREIVSECAQHRGEREDKHPTRLGRAPGKDDAHNGDDCRNAERKRGQRDASQMPTSQVSVIGMRGIITPVAYSKSHSTASASATTSSGVQALARASAAAVTSGGSLVSSSALRH